MKKYLIFICFSLFLLPFSAKALSSYSYEDLVSKYSSSDVTKIIENLAKDSHASEAFSDKYILSLYRSDLNGITQVDKAYYVVFKPNVGNVVYRDGKLILQPGNGFTQGYSGHSCSYYDENYNYLSTSTCGYLVWKPGYIYNNYLYGNIEVYTAQDVELRDQDGTTFIWDSLSSLSSLKKNLITEQSTIHELSIKFLPGIPEEFSFVYLISDGFIIIALVVVLISPLILINKIMF